MVQCEGFLSEIDPFAQGQIHVIAVTAQHSAGEKNRGRRGYNDGFIDSGGSTQRGGAKSVSRWGESCWCLAKLGAAQAAAFEGLRCAEKSGLGGFQARAWGKIDIGMRHRRPVVQPEGVLKTC